MWLLIPILIYSLIFLYIRHVYSYWERKGFPTERTTPNWQFLKQVYKREFQYVNAVSEAYAAGRREQLFGIYFFFRPTLLVRDLGLARTILENSYRHFHHTKWDYVKEYRKINLLEKLAPIFSVNHVDGMFRNIEKVGDYMVRHLQSLVMDSSKQPIDVDMQHILRIYSINIIGNLVYGLDSNNFEQTGLVFSRYIRNSLRNRTMLNSFTINHMPKKSSLTYRLRDIIKDSIESREDGGCIRKDILQLLVKFRNGNNIANGAKLKWHMENVLEHEKVLSITKVSKIAEGFLNMGFETIASTIVLTLLEVLQEPCILKKLLEEIKQMKEDPNNSEEKLTYADFVNLKYLNACIKETQRKHPGVPIIERVCRKNFHIPHSRYTIREGKTIMIPLMAIQRDEKYFAEPLKYKPDRFLTETEAGKKCNFIGYGLGAGICIAQNFSHLVVKVALVKLLQNFTLDLKENTKRLIIIHNPAPVIKSKEGFMLQLKNREIKSSFYL